MKKLLNVMLASLAIIFLQNNFLLSFEENKKEDNINVEPVQGKPHHYSVNMKFNKIDKVQVKTTINAESLGYKKDSYVLSKNEWQYDYSKNVLIVNRNIDDSKYIVRVVGKYQTPICVIANKEIDSSHIRIVVDGKIGIPGKDYRYDKSKNIIELLACETGKEKFFINYDYTKGSASLISGSPSELTLPLLKYLNFPTGGNAISLDSKGHCFSPTNLKFKSIWLIQLIPLNDGYTGQDIFSGFQWDSNKQKLTLNSPVNTQKFSVMIYGEIE